MGASRKTEKCGVQEDIVGAGNCECVGDCWGQANTVA